MTIENKELIALFEKIEENDWSVIHEGEKVYSLGKFSSAGQDFSINVEGETVEEIIESIYEAHENFDPSYEAYLWLDDTGHGKNGAPYEMVDVYNDMLECKEFIYDLFITVK